MNMWASELRRNMHLHILKLLFPSIFCWYFRYFVSETFIFRSPITSAYIIQSIINGSFLSLLMVWHYNINDMYADKTLTLRKSMYMRASGASEKIFAFSHSKTAISFNILLVLQKLCRYKWHTCWLTCMYRHISKCTDKTPKKHYWGGGGAVAPLPPPPTPTLATLVVPGKYFHMIIFMNDTISNAYVFQNHSPGGWRSFPLHDCQLFNTLYFARSLYYISLLCPSLFFITIYNRKQCKEKVY